MTPSSLRTWSRRRRASYAGALWAGQRWLGGNPPLARRLRGVREAIAREFGLKAKLAGPLIGLVLLAAMHREGRRLRRGRTYEPPTFYETNRAAAAGARAASPCRWVETVAGAEPEMAATLQAAP